jgi:hypothetical protein
MHNKIKLLILAIIICKINSAQIYPPAAGMAGSTAMYKDSSAFVNWATECKIIRGLQDAANISFGYTTVGDSSMALGVASSNGVVSLGDGGSAICKFQFPIKDGFGNDFAVFENSFDGLFLELAFVEVSSDGINYFRFPSHSLTDTLTQVGGFGVVDATKINNLAGKYKIEFGTPFNLSDLPNNVLLNKNAITHVKLIDCIGSINNLFAARDSYGNKINEPWPTPFASSGFDLDAIGVINQNTLVGINEQNKFDIDITVYPNPTSGLLNIDVDNLGNEKIEIEVSNVYGQLIFNGVFNTNQYKLNLSNYNAGLYYIAIVKNKELKAVRKITKN